MMRHRNVMVTAVEPEDIPQVVMWRNQSDIYSGFIEYEPLSTTGQSRFMEHLATDPTRRLWMISVSGGDDPPPYPKAVMPEPGAIPIGMVGLIDVDLRNRKCELGPIFIGSPPHRGQGYGRQAELLVLRHCFGHLGMHKVVTRVLVENVAGTALQLTCGMKEEAIRRDHVFRGGRFVDLRELAMFADEWAAVDSSL